MKKVLVFGTFDGLHEGHLDLFRQGLSISKGRQAYLIVVVARDSTIVKTKKRLPKFNENERLKTVQNCDLISEAHLGNEGDNPYKIIEEIKPDIICLGYDQTHFTDKLQTKLQEMGMSNIEIKRLTAYKPEIYKSSLLNK